MKCSDKWLRKKIIEQREDYLATYPNRGIAEIVADHLNGVLELLDEREKELREKLGTAERKEKEAHQRKDNEWEDIWSGYGEAIKEILDE